MKFAFLLAGRFLRSLRGFLVAGALWPGFVASAFPPAPHHILHGLVRDELGNPVAAADAEILFESSAGAKLSTPVESRGVPGQNYELRIPMDAGITDDAYMPTALKPTVPFKIRVRIGKLIYLPIEMTGNFAVLGQPGRKTQLNLTLGVDSDGDGLPDAWERAVIAALGNKQTLAEIKPGDDSDGDGLRNSDEYVAGTYAFDKKDGYALKIKGAGAGAGGAVLEFMSIRGRSYSIQASTDLAAWAPVRFWIRADGADVVERASYQAADVRVIEVEVPTVTGAELPRFFKLMVE